MDLWYSLRCWLGRPATYRELMDDGDWWFAMCKHCHRQIEVHEGIGGPPPLREDLFAALDCLATAWMRNEERSADYQDGRADCAEELRTVLAGRVKWG